MKKAEFDTELKRLHSRMTFLIRRLEMRLDYESVLNSYNIEMITTTLEVRRLIASQD